MSWSLERIGTKNAVIAAASADFDKCAAGYAGKEEEKDVLACKAQALSALAGSAPTNHNAPAMGCATTL